jgi:hypothetical protein
MKMRILKLAPAAAVVAAGLALGAPQASASQQDLGGLDMKGWCDSKYPNWMGTAFQGSGLPGANAGKAEPTNSHDAYSWECNSGGFAGLGILPRTARIDYTDVCVHQNGDGAQALPRDKNDPWSWYCFRDVPDAAPQAVQALEPAATNPAPEFHPVPVQTDGPPPVLGPQVPAGTTISGHAVCGRNGDVNEAPVGMWVDAQNGKDGWATLTPTGDGSDYTYTTDQPGTFALHLGCGGSPQSWDADINAGTFNAGSGLGIYEPYKPKS